MREGSNGWNTPANILTMIGLCLSLVGNVILWHQNSISELRVKEESLRADILQKHKDNWLRLIKTDLDNTKKKINLIRQRITLTQQGAPVIDFSGRQKALTKIENDIATLKLLEAEKNRLEIQITQLIE